ncbi:MAG: hypothetical protein JHD37_09485, partial [Ilumatobacteraceae bacterium]|nr:hypothetical protein [Ilumatobacteraceae bacterium]
MNIKKWLSERLKSGRSDKPSSETVNSVPQLTRNLRTAFLIVSAAVVLWAIIDPQTRTNFVSGSGIAQGALIAAIALGVVLTYRGSGIVNFANSAVAMYVAYFYAVLRRDGDLFLPPLPNPLALIEGVLHIFQEKGGWTDLPDWPTRISLGNEVSFWPALLISLVFAMLFGLVLHLLIFQPLRHSPPLAKVVASIGLFILLPAVIVRRFTIQPFAVRSMPFYKQDAAPLKLPFGIS